MQVILRGTPDAAQYAQDLLEAAANRRRPAP
jgi:hypothetical protein